LVGCGGWCWLVIRTPDQRLRVFVSSALDELTEERGAVAEAVSGLGMSPVRFESGARPYPPRELYRAYLAQSDVFVGVYWQRYGWVAPGMTVSGLEDEFGLSGGLPRLLYVKIPAPDREPRLAGLLSRVEKEGAESYRTFATPGELGRLVREDLVLLLTERFSASVISADAGREPAWSGGLPVTAPVNRLPVEVRGREELLAELCRPFGLGRVSRHREPGRTWVLAGLGGLGKSTCALVAARAAAERGWRVWWVPAADAGSLAGGVVEVLRQLEAPAAIVRSVREGAATAADQVWEFLDDRHAGGSRWLLVFDNADDPAVLAGSGAVSPADCVGWLRPVGSGMVIVTTRNKDPRTWGPGVTFRELAPLGEVTAAQVLADLCPAVADPQGQQARALGRRLGGLPLALHLAGTYLASPFARWRTFDDYRLALDGVELPEALADLDASRAEDRAAIHRTWDLSLDALAAGGRPQARQVLSLLSCYAPATPIPVTLLQADMLGALLGETQPEGTETMAGVAGSAHRRLREGLDGLAAAGLINLADQGAAAGGWAITVHPVVADVNRSRLLTSGQVGLDLVCASAVRLLAASGGRSSRRPVDWQGWRLVAPHLAALLDWAAGHLGPEALANLLSTCALAADALGAAGDSQAEELARPGAAAAARLGTDHPASLAVRYCLAQVVGGQGRNSEAEAMYRQLLADQQRVLGADHPATYGTRRSLAWMIECQGRHGEAGQMYQELAADQQQTLGGDDLDTLSTRNSLAWMMGMHGQFADAEILTRQILAAREGRLGPDDPATLSARHTLGYVLWRQGRHDEAEDVFSQVLAMRERVLGDKHPALLATRLRLARVYGDQGKLDEAEMLCRQVLRDRQRRSGDDHPSTLKTRSVLHRITGLQGRHADAERMGQQLLADQQRVLGAGHPEQLITRHNLAWNIEQQGRLAEAEQLCRDVLADRERVLGPRHPDTHNTRHRLAHILASQDNTTEAASLMNQVLTARNQILGPSHPDTITTRLELARLTQDNLGQ